MSNTLKLSIAVLLVMLSLAKAHHQMCADDMDEEACKMHMMMEMDKKIMEKHIDLIKMLMTKQIEMMNDAMKEMEADDPHMMKMKARMDILKADMETMGNMKQSDDPTKIQEMVENMYMDVKIVCDEGDEMCVMMREKYEKTLVKDSMMEMMMEFGNIWTHIYGSLREKDMMKYPMYKELNDMMEEMMTEKDMKEMGKKLIMIIRKMLKFQQTPYMKAMLMAVCDNCEL